MKVQALRSFARNVEIIEPDSHAAIRKQQPGEDRVSDPLATWNAVWRVNEHGPFQVGS